MAMADAGDIALRNFASFRTAVGGRRIGPDIPADRFMRRRDAHARAGGEMAVGGLGPAGAPS